MLEQKWIQNQMSINDFHFSKIYLFFNLTSCPRLASRESLQRTRYFLTPCEAVIRDIYWMHRIVSREFKLTFEARCRAHLNQGLLSLGSLAWTMGQCLSSIHALRRFCVLQTQVSRVLHSPQLVCAVCSVTPKAGEYTCST